MRIKNSLWIIFIVLLVAGCDASQRAQDNSTKLHEAEEVKTQPIDYLQEGVRLLKKQNIKEAIISFNNAIAQNPNDVEPHLILGKLFMDGGNFNDAIQHFESVVALQPDNAKVFLTLAKCYEQNGNIENAIKSAQRAALIFKAKSDMENYNGALIVVKILMNSTGEQINNNINREKKE